MDEFIGIIKIFAGNFAPQGWAFCNGQLLPISQYTAVFSILGTTYGGNGVSNFALPDLRGRIPLGFGSGPGLSNYDEGQTGGSETNALITSNLPPHTHIAQFSVSSGDATQSAATPGAAIATPGSMSGRSFAGTLGFNTATPDTLLNTSTVVNSVTGSAIPVNNLQPYLGVNYIICLQGIFPPRN